MYGIEHKVRYFKGTGNNYTHTTFSVCKTSLLTFSDLTFFLNFLIHFFSCLFSFRDDQNRSLQSLHPNGLRAAALDLTIADVVLVVSLLLFGVGDIETLRAYDLSAPSTPDIDSDLTFVMGLKDDVFEDNEAPAPPNGTLLLLDVEPLAAAAADTTADTLLPEPLAAAAADTAAAEENLPADAVRLVFCPHLLANDEAD